VYRQSSTRFADKNGFSSIALQTNKIISLERETNAISPSRNGEIGRIKICIDVPPPLLATFSRSQTRRKWLGGKHFSTNVAVEETG